MDHAPRQGCRRGDGGGGDVHAVFPAPLRVGVPAGALALEAPAGGGRERGVGARQGAAAEDARRGGPCLPGELDAAAHLQRVRDLLGEPWGLGAAGRERTFQGGGVAIRRRAAAVIRRAASRARWATPGRGAVVGPSSRRGGAHRGEPWPTARVGHGPGVVVATGPSAPQSGPRARRGDQVPPGGAQAAAPEPGGRQRARRPALGRPARRPARAPAGGGRWRRRRGRVGPAGRGRRGPAAARRDAAGASAPGRDADPRAGDEGHAGPPLAGPPGQDPRQAVGGLPGVGDHHGIARPPGDRPWSIDRRTTAAPKPHGPGPRLRENALDGTVTAAVPGPAGEPQPGDPSRPHPPGSRHPLAWAPRGGC
jgi:hypothetical protein